MGVISTLSFEIGPCLLDRIEFRGVRRQEEDFASGIADEFARPFGFVEDGVVHNNGHALGECGQQHFFKPLVE